GEPLRIVARTASHRAEASSAARLSPSRSGGIDAQLLSDKLGAMGGTLFHLAGLNAQALPEGLHLPVSELKALRRELVNRLTEALATGVERAVRQEPVLADLRERLRAHSNDAAGAET